MRGMVRGSLAVAAMAIGAAALAQVKDAPPPAPDMAAVRAAYQKLPDTPGTGAYPATKLVEATFADHVVYRPRNLAPFGKATKLGVVVWGNGGCSADGASARLHLAEIASHGYVAIAPGRIYSGPGATEKAPPRAPAATPGGPLAVATDYTAVKAGIDWALAENARKGSPYFGKIDPKMIAVAGHSCGGLQALQVAADPRIRAVMINNSGVFADGTNPISGIKVDKSLLKGLHTPILYILGGPTDIAYPNGMDDFAKIDGVPAMVINLPVGHGGTFMKPNGGLVAGVEVDWLAWQLRGDKKAARRFTGEKCGLCVDPAWTVQRKGIK